MEYIDVVDELGNRTGEIKSRSEVHEKGLLHKTVHIFLINDKNEILLQKRSPEKKKNPNKWTTSVSGHLSAGDESKVGAVRELSEEIGVTASEEELEYLFTMREDSVYKDIKDCEIVDVYLLKRNVNIEDFVLQKEEVSEVKWVLINEFSKMIEDCDKNNLVNHTKLFKQVVEIIEKQKKE